MASEAIGLSQFLLGMEPYVVIQCQADDDPENEAGYLLNIRAGGGLTTQDDILTLLLTVVEEATGVSPELYVAEIDAARAAAGLAPLAGVSPVQGEDHGA